MQFSHRLFILAAAFVLTVGSLTPVSAQEMTSPSDDTLQTTFVVFPKRTYTGTATKISASGVVTTGTFNLSLLAHGLLNGSATFDNVSTSYTGAVSRTSLGEKRLNGSGYLQPFPSLSLITISGTNNVSIPSGQIITLSTGATPTHGAVVSGKVQKIPLVITSDAAYGGLQLEDGSSLVFRCVRDADKATEN